MRAASSFHNAHLAATSPGVKEKEQECPFNTELYKRANLTLEPELLNSIARGIKFQNEF